MIEQLALNEQFLLMEEKLLQPDIRKSVKDLDALLEDAFIELGCSGQTYNKQEMIDILPTLPAVKFTLTDLQARLLADGVVLTIYRAVKHGEQNEPAQYSLRSSVWIREKGEWRIVFHQGTPSTAT
ncbi:MAG TPA: DUF4440 domain-containing protein [Syntrophomonas sp.]|nr:DUF4440 domain-containing protein [Syntrophomonas sp.]